MDYNKMAINSFTNYFLTWVPDRNKLARPCYLSLANQLEYDIASGKLAPGTRLPPQREIADYLGINFTTVTRAYNLCREKGLIYGVVGSGSFVAALPGYGDPDKEVIELGVVNGFGVMRQLISEAMQNVAGKGYLDKLCTYSEPAGHLHQRIAGVRWMAGRGVKVTPENTAIFSGAQSVISAALLSCFKVGDRIATDEYTYFNLIGTARLAHIILEPVRGDSSGMIPDELEKLCREKDISGVFLMPRCANPTTVTMSEAKLEAVSEICRKYRLTVIEDDNTGFPGGTAPLFARLPEQTIYICGSTMTVCSGLRVTYCAFAPCFRERLLGALRHLSIKTSSIDAELMTELINSGRADLIIEEKKKLALQANAVFSEIFPEYSDSGIESALFRKVLLPDSFANTDGNQTEKYFHSLGVNVYHSSRFAVGTRSRNGSFLRISVSSAENFDRLRRGLIILRNGLENPEKQRHF